MRASPMLEPMDYTGLMAPAGTGVAAPDRAGTARLAEPVAGAVERSTLERMPKWLICVPLVLQWLWLGLRHGSLTLPSAANPAITSGGLAGETKLEYFASMGALALSATARHCAFSPADGASMADIRSAMAREDIGFPLIAKPDLGMCGFGVQRVANEQALAAYVDSFPKNQTIVLQEYLPEEGEATRRRLRALGHAELPRAAGPASEPDRIGSVSRPGAQHG